jgi:heat-inducible transcriptional repressor
MAVLSPRSARILATLVAEHIQTAEPVGSARLVECAGLDVSSATVRNTLAGLEDLGFIWQPHTSAGRVPTDRGYRFYVDQLLGGFRSARSDEAVEARLRRGAGVPALAEDVLATVSQELSRSSKLIGFALPPASAEAVFQEIEFLPLAGSKVLVVVVAEGGRISRKAIDIGDRLTAAELHQAAGYLTTEFAGLSLERVRASIVDRLRQDRTLRDALVSRAIRLARSSLDAFPVGTPLFLDGASSLLTLEPDDGSGISMATLRTLMRMVEEKERLVRILNEYIDGSGLTVVIGHEHTAPDLRAFSLVAATYSDGPRRGTVGVIGPMRMHYSRTIAVVDGMAHAVSRVLQDGI